MLTVALCLAVNVAVFAVVRTVVLKPLPFERPDQLVTLFNAYPGAGVLRGANGVPDYDDRRAGVEAFAELAMYRVTGVTLGAAGEGGVGRVTGMIVTPSFFRVLQTTPHRGRLFTEAEGEVGQERKVVLSYGLWQARFAGQDQALGQMLRINGQPYEIVGVVPPGFRYINPEVQLWTAAAFTPEERSDERRHSNSWQQIARLRPDATVSLAQRQVDAINAANMERFPQLTPILRNAGFHTPVMSLHDELVASVRPTLFLLWGGVLCVLAIGCINIANLYSIRASARMRELATRHALGASVRSLARQLLTESLLVACTGGVVGLALAWLALRAAQGPALEQLPLGTEIAIDGGTVLFSLALVILVGLAVGALPALAIRRTNLAEVVREEGRSGTVSRRTQMTRRLLVTSQVAGALMLLIAAGVLLASFERVLAIDPGFEPQRVVTGSLSLPSARYPDAEALRVATDRLLERVRALPGVEAVGMTSFMPLSDDHDDSVILAEGYAPAPGESLIAPNHVVVSPGYFDAMGTRLLAGRVFDDRDSASAPPAIIVDEQLAAKFWPGQSPLGRYMYFPGDISNVLQPPPREEWFTVIGVVENVRMDGLVDGGEFRSVGAFYRALAQSPRRSLTLALRSQQAPGAMGPAVQAAIADVDPELPLYGVRTMEERVTRALVDRRTPMALAVSFAVVALLLAAVGIYGVLAYQVRQRTREIGIRIALGAATTNIFSMVIREGALMLFAGATLGVMGAYALRATLNAQLYGVSTFEPPVVAAVGALLLLVAFVAMVVPARRAAQTDPTTSLSHH